MCRQNKLSYCKFKYNNARTHLREEVAVLLQDVFELDHVVVRSLQVILIVSELFEFFIEFFKLGLFIIIY